MILRCYNKKHVGYKNYGGRGITVCEEWRGQNGYKNFKLWAIKNGFEKKLQLDRIDNELGYFPNNCRWVDRKTNMSNTRRNIKINNKTLTEISEETGIKYNTLASRYRMNDDIVLKEKTCKNCGKNFLPKYYNQKFCSEQCKKTIYSMKIESNLKEIRKKKNISLEQLAELTGISKSHLNYIENNIKEPSLSIAVNLANTLNINIEDLYNIIN